MATVTKIGLAAQDVAAPVFERSQPAVRAAAIPALVGNADHTRGRLYSCPQCGHRLQVFGLGRHRVYFEPENAGLDDPVMDHACPVCGHALPGSNRS
jgi:DNA-directed RNA polymerase subunit RPC12/RpoP